MSKPEKYIISDCPYCGAFGRHYWHHIFNGSANRKLSEKYGMTAMLHTAWHNIPPNGVHHNKANDLKLKQFAQRKFIEMYPDLDFREIFGRSYL